MLSFRDNYFFRSLPLWLSFLVAITFSITTIRNFSDDTINVFNAAFASAAALSGLCFRMASNISLENAQHRQKMGFSGERFLHAAFSFLLASTMKYVALDAVTHKIKLSFGEFQVPIITFFNSIAFLLFAWAIIDAFNGAKIMNEVLWERSYNEED